MADTITVPDKMYDADTVEAISRLRQERWLLFGILASNADSKHVIPDHMVDRYRNRLAVVNKELFTLTENPIYNV